MNINTDAYWDSTYSLEIGKNEWRRYVVGFNKIKTYLGFVIEKNDTVLDIGCGYGMLMDMLQTLNCDLTGWDISEVAIREIIKKGYKGRSVDFNQYDVPSEGIFSHVIATEFLEHVEDPLSTLDKMFKLAKKSVIFSVPNNESKTEMSPEHLGVYNKERIKKLIKKLPLKHFYIEEYIEEFIFIGNDGSGKLIKNPCLLVIVEKQNPSNTDTIESFKRADFRDSKADICVIAYSSDHSEEHDHYEIISRCLKSIISNTDSRLYTLHIGCNNLSPRAMHLVDSIVSTYNAHKYIGDAVPDRYGKIVYPKYPLMRKIYDSINGKWVIWFDDDSYVIENDWILRLEETINNVWGADQFGLERIIAVPISVKEEWIESAEWHNPERVSYKRFPDGEKIVAPFIHGAFYAISRKAINSCGIPDRRLFHNNGDWTTGMALYHKRFKISHFSYGLSIGNAPRRGIHNDTWCPIGEAKTQKDAHEEETYAMLSTDNNYVSKKPITGFNRQGEVHFSQNRFQDAKACFLHALKKDHKNKEAYNNLGVVLHQQQNVDDALECFVKALEIDPFYVDAIHNICDLLYQLNKLNEAIPFLETVIEKHPDNIELVALLRAARNYPTIEADGNGNAS